MLSLGVSQAQHSGERDAWLLANKGYHPPLSEPNVPPFIAFSPLGHEQELAIVTITKYEKSPSAPC